MATDQTEKDRLIAALQQIRQKYRCRVSLSDDMENQLDKDTDYCELCDGGLGHFTASGQQVTYVSFFLTGKIVRYQEEVVKIIQQAGFDVNDQQTGVITVGSRQRDWTPRYLTDEEVRELFPQ